MKLHLLNCAALVCLLAALPIAAWAQDEPVKPFTTMPPPEPAPPVQAPRPPLPEDFLPSSTQAPIATSTAASLALESAGTEPGDVPPPVVVPETDPSQGLTDFWSTKSHFCQRTCTWMHNLWEDQCNFYSLNNLAWIALGVGIVAPLANSPLDEEFRNWYQGQNGNNTRTTQIALQVKNLGEGGYMIPAFLVGGAASIWLEACWPSTQPIEEWFGRTLRAWATGAPTLLVLQYALGSGRPYEGVDSSYWHFGKYDNAASGHAFIGSIPFLTAAEMVDNPFLKGALVVGSFATGWSRIQTDDHYLSEVILGWWIAWRAVRSVTMTQEKDNSWDIFPSATADGGAQINFLLRY